MSLSNSSDFQMLVSTVRELLAAEDLNLEAELLQPLNVSIEQTSYDNWNGGTYIYTIYVEIDVKVYIQISQDIRETENLIKDKFILVTRRIENEQIAGVMIIPKSSMQSTIPNPHRPFSITEKKKREELSSYLGKISEDQLIADILLPLFRQLGFFRISSAGHKDKALEYGKDIWMKFTLPTQHVLYFGIQVKKGKLDSSGVSKGTNTNISEIHNQLLMMLGHEIFDPESNRKVLVDHAFIIAAGDITKAAKNWLGERLDASKRSQVLFMDKEDIINLYIVTNLPLPEGAVKTHEPTDDLPF